MGESVEKQNPRFDPGSDSDSEYDDERELHQEWMILVPPADILDWASDVFGWGGESSRYRLVYTLDDNQTQRIQSIVKYHEKGQSKGIHVDKIVSDQKTGERGFGRILMQ